MTVCIAARSGATIVAAADRMLTAGDVQFESTSGIKIQPLSNLAFIMTAGDAALSAELVKTSVYAFQSVSPHSLIMFGC